MMPRNGNYTRERVLLTGATGFVGRRLYPALEEYGYEVVSATRDPEAARLSEPERNWVEFDVERPNTIESALEDCDSALYLVHQMAQGAGYRRRERLAARRFVDVADAKGLRRIVYLGGVVPEAGRSEHLQSRFETGRLLRSGEVSTIELRAAMIVGRGSASWQLVRDLAARLPAMILPMWTKTRSQPIWIGDVVGALVAALEYDSSESRHFNIPGPEILTVAEILERTSRLLGHRPWTFDVPLLSPRLSSYWLRFVTRADRHLARELIEGLKYDLVVRDAIFWEQVDLPARLAFDEAARRELQAPRNASIRAVERAMRVFSRRVDSRVR